MEVVPDPDLDAELVRAAEFRVALRRFLRRTEEIAGAAGLTPQRYTLLLMVRASRGGRARIMELVRALQLSQSAVTELVQRAEEAGLLVRERVDDDARACAVRLTEEGERRLMTAFRALAAERDAMVDAFAHADRRLRALAGRS